MGSHPQPGGWGDAGMSDGNAPRSPLPPGVDPGYSHEAVAAAHAAGLGLCMHLQGGGRPAACKVTDGRINRFDKV